MQTVTEARDWLRTLGHSVPIYFGHKRVMDRFQGLEKFMPDVLAMDSTKVERIRSDEQAIIVHRYHGDQLDLFFGPTALRGSNRNVKNK